eukprot:snap_masked-scaffold_60-processed-gene-0.11-mRNA-1 protein AED:0.20 eAED:0.22 QI:0/-1/0/1/-1/1/1/0/361
MLARKNKKVIVMDLGSYRLRTGYAGEEAPLVRIRTVLGRQEFYSMFGFLEYAQLYFDDEAISKSKNIPMNFPIKSGIVTNWDDMIEIWRHTFYTALQVKPSEYPIILSEAPLNPKKQRQRTMEIMFEHFSVPSLCVYNSAFLSLYSSGRITGVVLDSGFHVSRCVPIFEGHLILYSIVQNRVGGNKISKYLKQLLNERNLAEGIELFDVTKVEEVKRIHCLVRNRKNADVTKENIYTEPAEILFDPSKFNIDDPGLHSMVVSSISNCDLEIQKELYSNIVLCGGNSLIKGFPDRLITELETLCPEKIMPKIFAIRNRELSTWKGASKIASTPNFSLLSFTRNEYKNKKNCFFARDSCMPEL